MGEYTDNSTRASDPVAISLSVEKLILLEGEAELPFLKPPVINEHLSHGDSRAALVVGLDPLTVAAYTDELDCVALLEFPKPVQEHYGFEVGQRLLTVNRYEWRENLTTVRDLWLGPAGRDTYRNFHPMIADLLSDDTAAIERRKASIAEAEWRRTEEAAEEARVKGFRPRDGRPRLVNEPREPSERWGCRPPQYRMPARGWAVIFLCLLFLSAALVSGLFKLWPGIPLFLFGAFLLRPRGFLPPRGPPEIDYEGLGLKVWVYPGHVVTRREDENREGQPPITRIEIGGFDHFLEVSRVPGSPKNSLRAMARIMMRAQLLDRREALREGWETQDSLGELPALCLGARGTEVEVWCWVAHHGDDAIYAEAVMGELANRERVQRVFRRLELI